MSRRPDRRATYEDLKRIPDTMVAEILDGELIVTPRPAVPHAHASSVLGSDILGPFHRKPGGPGGPGGWWILDEPELHLHGDVVVPDLGGWRRERFSVLPNGASISEAPDWVCEILSPSTARHDRSAKMHIYAREGVGFLWIVEPLARTVETYHLDGKSWRTNGAVAGDVTSRLEPFEGVELDLSRWWLEIEPPPV